MKTLTVFDPAMCCSTGVCGSDVDQVLVDFSADVQWLKGRGVQIDRYNLAQQPMSFVGTVAKLAMRQPFVLFKGLTFQKLCLPGAFRPGDHHNKMLRPGLCVVHASPQYL